MCPQCIEVTRCGGMCVSKSGASVQCVVGGESAPRRHCQVVRHSADAQRATHLIVIRTRCLLDQPERRHDDGVEEAQGPREIVE